MIIKMLLISVSVILLVWFLINRNTLHAKAWLKLGALLFILFGIFVILFPQLANEVANLVGVGRGADLILYLLVLAFLFFVLNFYIKSKDEQRMLVVLARKIALIEASNSPHNLRVQRNRYDKQDSTHSKS